jgi:uncharacterized lipoprotein YajG
LSLLVQYTRINSKKQAKKAKKAKKMIKITIFLTIVLVLFTSCSKKIENCEFSPDFELSDESMSESLDGIVQIEKLQAKTRCKF